MRLRGNLLLLTAAFIWGTTFVAQMTGMDSLGPFSYAACRYFLGVISVLFIWRMTKTKREEAKRTGRYNSGWKIGLGAGTIMFVGTSLQQVGMLYTTAGKASFLTCLYIVLVPLGGIFLHQQLHWENWLGAGIAIVGLYFLCIQENISLAFGDMLELVSALFWAAHILFIGHFAYRSDAIEISAAQLFVCMLLSTILAVRFESFTWQDVQTAAFAIFYGGVMSSGVAFTLQIFGQKYAVPSQAAVIMSLEGVFGALSSVLILHEAMSLAQVVGCCLMFAGMIVTQLPLKKSIEIS